MPRLNVANNAGTVLVQACTFSDTTIYVQDVSKFPSPPFRITVDNEIMEVTAVDTNLKAFTVSRAQEGTTATSHNIGASAENRWTAGTYGELAGMADLTWTNVQGKPSSFTPSVHKNTHATGGSDALAPADIGAAAASDLAAHLADTVHIDAVRDDYKVHVVSGVIRYYNSIGRWDLLENQGEGHPSINVASVNSNATSITLTFDNAGWGTERAVNSFCITVDETLAKEGIFCGASVGSTTTTIYLYRYGAHDYIYYNGSQWVSFVGNFSMQWNTDTLTLTRLKTHQITPLTYPMVTTRNSPYQAQLNSLGTNTIEVVFRDFNGNLVTTPDVNMKFFIYDPHSYTQINPNNFPNQYGNLWFVGTMLSRN